MARHTAEKFLELLAADRQLQTHQQMAEAWSVTALTRLAHGKGFIFSETDLKLALKSYTGRRQV